MTQGAGAGQGPVVRTATVRDFRVPPYAQMPEPPTQPGAQPGPDQPPHPGGTTAGGVTATRRVSLTRDNPHGRVATESGAPTRPDPRVVARTEPVRPHQPALAVPTALAAPAVPPAPAVPTVSAAPSAHTSTHPGNAVPRGEMPEGYTPTARDLPVISREDDTVRLHAEPAKIPAADGPGPLFVVGDVHGYLDELVAALAEQGLIDSDGGWAAGNARLWFLGDFTDRGPDGIGVIDLVMRLSAEAAAAGGYCKALMGNHELLILGAKRFADAPVNSGGGTATFQAAWLLNGGQKTDMERLEDVHIQWMSRLDAMVEQDGHLLMHSDTTAYLDYGATITDVNDTISAILTRNDADECWDLFRKLTKRFAFRDNGGPEAVRELLAAYGGRRVVHGHSPIPYLLGDVGTEEAADGEDSAGPVVDGPHVYADGLAIAMDGGVTMAGKLLVVQLPLPD